MFIIIFVIQFVFLACLNVKIKAQGQNTIFLQLFLVIYSLFTLGNNSLSFLPDVPRCIGDQVEMICFVVPSGTDMFIDSTALISFDGSVPTTPTNVNGNQVAGVNTSRYFADTTNLVINNERPGVRLTISNYQASDGAILFGCHGVLSGLAPSSVLISGYPQSLAGMIYLFS